MGKPGKNTYSGYFFTILASWVFCLYFIGYSEIQISCKFLTLLSTIVLTIFIGLIKFLDKQGIFEKPLISYEKNFAGPFFIYKSLCIEYFSIQNEFNILENTILQHANLSKLYCDSQISICAFYLINPYKILPENHKCICYIGICFEEKFLATQEIINFLDFNANCKEKVQLHNLAAIVLKFPYKSQFSYIISNWKFNSELLNFYNSNITLTPEMNIKNASLFCEIYKKSEIMRIVPIGNSVKELYDIL